MALTWPEPPREYKEFEDGCEGLLPPRIPTEPITVFGEPMSFDETPPGMGPDVPVLYDPSAPPLLELKKINHKILFSFQHLVGIMANGTDNPETCFEHITHLFKNAHDLLQKLRTVQGYEHLHYNLRQNNKKLEEFKQEFDKHLASATQLKSVIKA